ncbi:hypothetical protein, conserved [Angomonas deanei]|uniref:Uncharacterized protein n=1 Tax=Angomonas deanei TaxID=59799 RepID=A0A7G2CN45_9TRYP|nr:hypothetical protein, conserved [Angomonas deanei]
MQAEDVQKLLDAKTAEIRQEVERAMEKQLSERIAAALKDRQSPPESGTPAALTQLVEGLTRDFNLRNEKELNPYHSELSRFKLLHQELVEKSSAADARAKLLKDFESRMLSTNPLSAQTAYLLTNLIAPPDDVTDPALYMAATLLYTPDQFLMPIHNWRIIDEHGTALTYQYGDVCSTLPVPLMHTGMRQFNLDLLVSARAAYGGSPSSQSFFTGVHTKPVRKFFGAPADPLPLQDEVAGGGTLPVYGADNTQTGVVDMTEVENAMNELQSRAIHYENQGNALYQRLQKLSEEIQNMKADAKEAPRQTKSLQELRDVLELARSVWGPGRQRSSTYRIARRRSTARGGGTDSLPELTLIKEEWGVPKNESRVVRIN